MTPSCFKFFLFFQFVIFFNPGNNNLDLIKSYNTYNDLEREFHLEREINFFPFVLGRVKLVEYFSDKIR